MSAASLTDRRPRSRSRARRARGGASRPSAPARSAALSRTAAPLPAHVLGDLVAEEPVLHPAHGEEILEGAPCPIADAVLGLAKAALPVIHRHFEDSIAAHLEKGRHEAVKALVEDQVAKALAAKRPERAAAVLDGFGAEPVAHAIGDARGGSAHPRIAVAAVDAPAGHRVPLVEMAQHPGDVVRIVLEVGVHHHYPSSPHRLEPRVRGRRLASIGLQPEEPSPRILLVKPRTISALRSRLPSSTKRTS